VLVAGDNVHVVVGACGGEQVRVDGVLPGERTPARLGGGEGAVEV
jgi:hypothetical protein